MVVVEDFTILSSLFSDKADCQFAPSKLKGRLFDTTTTTTNTQSPTSASLSQRHQQSIYPRSRKHNPKSSTSPSSASDLSAHSDHEFKWLANGGNALKDEVVRPSNMAAQKYRLNKAANAKLPSSRQRRFLFAFFILAVIRLHFALSSSYIHPDEHFQGPEVVVGELFGWKSSLPWEFTEDNAVNSPIRSILPIWIVYGLPLRFIRFVDGLTPDPMLLFRALRLTFCCLSFLNDWAVYHLAGEARGRTAVLLYASSYVTWTFQTHTFSNSIEALLVTCSLVAVLAFRNTRAALSWAAFALGILASLGVFFRITFPAFLFPAIASCIPDLLRRPQKLILPGFAFLLGAFISIASDTYYFSPNPSLWHPVITPWSNFKYNVNALNLAEHGLHPPWTHLLVNLPCLLGPALFIPSISAQPFLTSLKQLFGDICFLCSISGLILLSSRPHQEFRFLLPIIPLLLVSLSRFLPEDLFQPLKKTKTSKLRSKNDEKVVDSAEPPCVPLKSTRRYYGWCCGWIAFNLLAGIFMGSLHQSAIVPTTQYLSNRIRQIPPPPPCLHFDGANSTRQTRMIWHRTYPAPDWLFAQPLTEPNVSIEIFNLGGKWNRLWELLSQSAKVPLEQAKVERDEEKRCDAWYSANNNTLQRTFVIAPLSATPLEKAILHTIPKSSSSGSNTNQSMEHWKLFPIRRFEYHINLDDVDLSKESLVDTVARVVGKHGLGVWLLVSI